MKTGSRTLVTFTYCNCDFDISIRAMLLHGQVMPTYVVRPSVRLSVSLSGVTLVYADRIS